MLLFFLLLILVAAIVANVQIHKWQRQRRLQAKSAPKPKAGKPTAKAKPQDRIDVEDLDWEALEQDELELLPTTATPTPKPAPRKVEPAPVKPVKAAPIPKGDFSALERALLHEQLSGAPRDEAMAQLLKADLLVPAPEPGEKHVVLDMDDGGYVPVATHPMAASIALGYLAEGMQQSKGAQVLRELRGGDVGLLVVARNPQKPTVARLWKIQPEDL